MRSGVTINCAFEEDTSSLWSSYWWLLTVVLGIRFLFVQYNEWLDVQFSLGSGIGGSIFFIITGYHGLHVAIGIFFNIFVLLRSVVYDRFFKIVVKVGIV